MKYLHVLIGGMLIHIFGRFCTCDLTYMVELDIIWREFFRWKALEWRKICHEKFLGQQSWGLLAFQNNHVLMWCVRHTFIPAQRVTLICSNILAVFCFHSLDPIDRETPVRCKAELLLTAFGRFFKSISSRGPFKANLVLLHVQSNQSESCVP